MDLVDLFAVGLMTLSAPVFVKYIIKFLCPLGGLRIRWLLAFLIFVDIDNFDYKRAPGSHAVEAGSGWRTPDVHRRPALGHLSPRLPFSGLRGVSSHGPQCLHLLGQGVRHSREPEHVADNGRS